MTGTRHLNYSLGTLYVMWMLFRHLTGSNAKQVSQSGRHSIQPVTRRLRHLNTQSLRQSLSQSVSQSDTVSATRSLTQSLSHTQSVACLASSGLLPFFSAGGSYPPLSATPRARAHVHTHIHAHTRAQVMLFRLRAHQSYAVVFSFLSTMYSLYEYAAKGIPYRRDRAKEAENRTNKHTGDERTGRGVEYTRLQIANRHTYQAARLREGWRAESPGYGGSHGTLLHPHLFFARVSPAWKFWGRNGEEGTGGRCAYFFRSTPYEAAGSVFPAFVGRSCILRVFLPPAVPVPVPASAPFFFLLFHRVALCIFCLITCVLHLGALTTGVYLLLRLCF